MAVSTVGIVEARGYWRPPRPRGWRRLTIAIVALVTLVVNLAHTAQTAHAAELPPGMRTLSIPIPAEVDRHQLQGLVDDINSRPGLLTDTTHEWSNLYGMVLPGAPFSVETDFDGVFALSGSHLTLTIEAPEAQAQDLSWWADALVYGATLVLQIVIRSLCVGAFAAASAGTATLPAIVLCAGAAGFFQQLIYQAIVISQTTEPDPGAWGNALLKALMSALQGVLWEGAISKFSKELLPVVLGKAGKWLFEQGKAFVQYWEAAGAGMQRLGSRLVSGTPAFIEGFLAAWRAVGSPSVNLRVLPLGDSITYGVGTPDNSSYRAHLSNLLRAGDVDGLDYVGAQRNGTLADRDHEGHPGWTISQINAIAPCAIREHRPNVVTLHIGTNDMARNVAVDTAPDRLRSLIRRITDQAPETSVVVATLIPSTVPTTMNRIQRYNEAIPGIVAEFQRRGRPVFLADMGAVTPGDLTDSLHPNANGYRKMAEAFARTIDGVQRTGGFFTARNGFPGACGTGPDSGAGGGTTEGAENPTTSSMNGWRYDGQVASGVGATREEVRFADLNGDGRDDYLVVGAQGQVRAWINNRAGGSTSWSSLGQVASGAGAREAVRFADLDGDGRDDYLVVDAQGVTQGWLNAGTGDGVSWASQGVVASGVGASRDAVRFADVNGDGRDDYVVLDADGVAKGWLNTRSPSGMGWSYAGVVASGVGATRDQVRFADLDGDSRDDYLVVQPQGQVRAWLNTFGESGAGWLNQGQIADGVGASLANVEFADVDGGGNSDYLVVNGSGQVSAWVSDVYATSDRWDRLGVIASGVGATLAEVRFADLNGDRRADYLVVGPQGQVRAWLNDRADGSSWKYLGEVAAGAGPREEVRFADLTGDGRDDYLLLGAQGQVRLWVNVPGGPTGISWQSKGEVASGSGPRDSIRFGDVNGDGRDDYLVVGAQAQVTAWFNTPGGSGGVSWVAQGDIASGLGVPGSLIDFADVDGDRRDDYLVVNDHARVWAWRNNRGGGGATWIAEGQIAAGVGATRDQLFLADFNGDLRDDYLVSSTAGVVTGWTSNGLIRKG
ncbi:FG-GAP-like repeat-containing protein [Herbidospora cretacea]|uniref:FG-GAP-like repeat-containing protein n=1 Tax=Herbidospora cretacea TaxID=28444 RepID=UPI0007739C80|nr:FG-GAP-like repeat-containing protein [Herbidospora cretacea]